MVTRRLQAERRTGSVRRPKTRVPPTVLCNQPTNDDDDDVMICEPTDVLTSSTYSVVQIVSDVENALTSKLSACKSSVDCQLAVVRSLGNARLPQTINTLVELAVSSSQAAVSEAALNALTRFDTQVVRDSTQVKYKVK